MATGPFAVPFVPPIAGGLAPDVVQMHSVAYRNPGTLPSGAASWSWAAATRGSRSQRSSASVREVHLSIGSRQAPLPQRFLGRDLFWWLTRLRLMEKSVETRIGRRMRSREPVLVGSSPRKLRRRHGVRIWPRAVSADGRTVGFADGASSRSRR